jgi:DNA-binding CsgD family transcriptional regulator
MSVLTYPSVDAALADALARAQALRERACDALAERELGVLCRLIEAVRIELAAGAGAGAEAHAVDGDAVHHTGAVQPLPPLTPRESEVLQLITCGLSNKEIAETLGIAERTAAFHVGNVLSKLGADGRVEAVRIAFQAGWLALA